MDMHNSNNQNNLRNIIDQIKQKQTVIDSSKTDNITEQQETIYQKKDTNIQNEMISQVDEMRHHMERFYLLPKLLRVRLIYTSVKRTKGSN